MIVDELSGHEIEILSYLERYFDQHHRAPSFDEIRGAAGLSSKDHVSRDLKRLEHKGYVELIPRIARGIRLRITADGRRYGGSTFHVPLLGTIAAGQPIPVPEAGVAGTTTDLIELTRDIVKDQRNVYALRVKGNSMIDALINDGDIVIMHHQEQVENGEMAAVWLTDRQETTLKRFYHEGKRVRLQPENRAMAPLYLNPQQVRVQGKVIAVIRQV
jgi:repressor LexA